MSLLHYLLDVATALVSPPANNHSNFQFFHERDTVFIDQAGDASTIKTVLPAVADSILERLLDYNDLLSIQIICLLQPSFNEYDDFLRRDTGCRQQTGWLRRFLDEIQHIRANLQVFVLHSSTDMLSFVPYKHLEGNLNGIPTIVFTQHLLLLLQSASSIDEENAILAAIVVAFLRELHHLLLFRRRYLSNKWFETVRSRDDVQQKVLGGTCGLVELFCQSETKTYRQHRLTVRFDESQEALVVGDAYVEDFLNWIIGSASRNLAVPFLRADSRCIVGSCTDKATMDMLQSSRIRVKPDVHHHIYMVKSPLQ